MKKIAILLTLVLILAGCSNKNKEIENNANGTNVTDSEESKDKDEILLHFEGNNEKYSAEITVSDFTDEDADLIKEEYGEDSDEYLSLQDNRPTYKVESFILYTGAGNEDLKSVTELKISIPSFDLTQIYVNEQDIVKTLQGKENISHNHFIYEDNRNELPSNEDTIEMTGTFDGNSELDFNIELKAVK